MAKKKIKSDNISKGKLSNAFNKFAEKSVKDFPKLKNSFIFYSMPTDQLYAYDLGGKHHSLLEDAFDEIEHVVANDNSPVPFALKHGKYDILVYKKFSKRRVMTSDNETYLQEVEANLEHELGHLVAPGGYAKEHNFAESVADAFAFIRMQQKYADMGSAIKATSWVSSLNFVLYNEQDHFTAPVTTELCKIFRAGHDLSKLSPVQSANMAYRLSLKHAMPTSRVKDIAEIFEPVRSVNGQKNLQRSLDTCARIMMQDHGALSADVFTIGKWYLEPFLNNDNSLLALRFSNNDIKRLKLKGKLWQKLRSRIAVDNIMAKKPYNELDRLEVLGAFDENKRDIINPAKYETTKNKLQVSKAKQQYAKKLG